MVTIDDVIEAGYAMSDAAPRRRQIIERWGLEETWESPWSIARLRRWRGVLYLVEYRRKDGAQHVAQTT